MNRRELGTRAEGLALRFLEQRGLKRLASNFGCRFGEIDLIMQHGDCLAIVEVRYRGSASFSAPALTVDESKQRKIASATLAFLSGSAKFRDWPIRFDVIAIECTENRPGAIQWIKDAFRV